jgi:hypothetical protein
MKVSKEKYLEILEKAERAYSDKRYLEAFLIQACLIEGIVRAYAVSKLYVKISGNSGLEEKLNKWQFANILDALLFSEKIDTALHKKLKEYNKQRNIVVHELLSGGPEFNDELKAFYESGREMKGLIVDDIQKQLDPAYRYGEIEKEINNLGQELKMHNESSRSYTIIQASIYGLLLELMSIADGQGEEFKETFPNFGRPRD